MAVEKSAKKTATKKASVKKVAAKKIAKKAPAKKGVAKKATAKKVAAKKSVAKKAPAKKVAKKAVGKRATSKKVTGRKVTRKTPDRIVIDAIAPFEMNSSRFEIISTTPQPKSAPFKNSQEISDRQGLGQSQKSSSRVVLAVIVGVILIAIFVVARNHNTSNIPKPSTPVVKSPTTPTPVASPITPASPTEMTTAPATPSAPATTAATTSTDLPPVAIVAHYNPNGATIYWRADTNASGLTTYNIEKSSDGGTFKLIATVPATQLSLDVTESDTNGWTSFKVSAVYSDGSTIAGKVFGLPGQYS